MAGTAASILPDPEAFSLGHPGGHAAGRGWPSCWHQHHPPPRHLGWFSRLQTLATPVVKPTLWHVAPAVASIAHVHGRRTPSNQGALAWPCLFPLNFPTSEWEHTQGVWLASLSPPAPGPLWAERPHAVLLRTPVTRLSAAPPHSSHFHPVFGYDFQYSVSLPGSTLVEVSNPSPVRPLSTQCRTHL